MFILLGRDKHASLLVKLWADLRAMEGEDVAKVTEAIQCANAMDEFRRKRKAATDTQPKAATHAEVTEAEIRAARDVIWRNIAAGDHDPWEVARHALEAAAVMRRARK
jgi:hypothetical protein